MIAVFIVFIILLFLGLPVAFSIGISGSLYFFQHPEIPVMQVAQLTCRRYKA